MPEDTLAIDDTVTLLFSLYTLVHAFAPLGVFDIMKAFPP
jgi:hypothetical protein